MSQISRPAPGALALSLLLTALVAASAHAGGEASKPNTACGVQGVEPGGVYDHPVTLELENPLLQAGGQLYLDGRPLAGRQRIDRDGEYSAEVRSAGPLLQPWQCDPILFTVDTTPPTVDFVRPDWLPEGALPRVQVRDDHLASDSVEVFLDGEPYDPAQPPGLGEHVLEAVAEDRAGNVTMSREKVVQESLGCTPEVWLEYVPAATVLSAVHYFPWYTQSNECSMSGNPPHPTPSSLWCNCIWYPKNQQLRPARGFYGSNSAAVVGAQLDQMIDYGVDVVSIEWTGNPSVTSNIVNVVVPAIANRNLKFVILYDSAVRLVAGDPPINLDSATIRNKIIGDFQTFASSALYFKHPKYLKFGNEPVIYLYISRAYTGSSTNIANTFDALRQAALDNGFSGLYLVADHLYWGPPDWVLLGQTNARAMTSFAPVNPDQGIPQGSANRPIRQWANKMATLYQTARSAQSETGPLVDLTPGVFVQWNNIGLSPTINPFCNWQGPPEAQYGWNLVDGTDWSYMLQTAGLNQAYVAERHILKPSCAEMVQRNPSNGTSIVWSYSYNEWYEGSGVEELTTGTPAYPYRFGLQALQRLHQKLP